MTIDTNDLRIIADEQQAIIGQAKVAHTLRNAADTIDTLREQLTQEQRDHAATKAELERMREALEEIKGFHEHDRNDAFNMWHIAMLALKGGTDQC